MCCTRGAAEGTPDVVKRHAPFAKPASSGVAAVVQHVRQRHEHADAHAATLRCRAKRAREHDLRPQRLAVSPWSPQTQLHRAQLGSQMARAESWKSIGVGIGTLR